jgi:hypothetical protein
MLTALLKGKLSSEQENMEDILTSSVFGAFQYAEASEALIRFLRKSELVYGDDPIADNAWDLEVHFEDYEFWPMWSGLEGVDNCEPDLKIRIHNPDGKDVLAVIEAKFRSGKSSYPTKVGNISDQLAKQWVHLNKKAQEKSCIPWLIYLTADTATPMDSIQESKDELCEKLGFSDEVHQLRISWLSWRVLADLFKNSDKRQLSELSSLAEYLGLAYFKGVGQHGPLPELHYRFNPSSRLFKWSFEQMANSNWRLSNDR